MTTSRPDPLVSIIIPVYNAEPYIERCLGSVIGQSYRNLEVVVVDDGSTDGSGKLCDAMAARDARIAVLHKPNSGVSDARNAGLRVASGEFIQFVDSDDFVDEAMTETLVQAQAADDSDLVITGFVRIRSTSGQRCVHTCNNELRGVGPAQFLRNFDELGKRQLLRSGGNKLYRSSLIGAIGLSFESEMSYAEDSVFNLKYMKHCNRFTVLSVSHYYYIYGHSAESLTSTYQSDIYQCGRQEIIATRDLFDAHPELVHELVKVEEEYVRWLVGYVIPYLVRHISPRNYSVFANQARTIRQDDLLVRHMGSLSLDSLGGRALLCLLRESRFEGVYLLVKLGNLRRKASRRSLKRAVC